jgi:hypothetical protein
VGIAIALLAVLIRPLWQAPDLRAVADRTHAWTVFVSASSGGERATASGVLIQGGLVLTDLHGLLSRQPDGTLAPAEITVVVDGVGPMPASLAGGDVALGIAVLRLPPAAQSLPGATIATEDPNVADQLLAMGTDGNSVDVLGVKVDHVDADARLRTSAQLPDQFRGGPLFDAKGELAGLQLPQGAAVASSVLRMLEQK